MYNYVHCMGRRPVPVITKPINRHTVRPVVSANHVPMRVRVRQHISMLDRLLDRVLVCLP